MNFAFGTRNLTVFEELYQTIERNGKHLFKVLHLLLPLILMILPQAVWADTDTSSLDFKPPPGDVSVVFLGNIFGVVDGVLAGTGSQIAGQMFGVFNTAVLSLGGIIIIYTLMVSTMNTAQEGQFLGQRWSSIWVPMRSVGGVVLILPKASGYCVMQIFVMWVVVQGVGAADKIWNQALDYLNQGNAIVKPNVDPVTQMHQSGGDAVINGAYGILSGQVCMLGMYQLLTNYQSLLQSDTSSSGLCETTKNAQSGDSDYNIHLFCTTQVPNFIDSVQFVNDTSSLTSGDTFIVSMPTLETDPYRALEGICGTIKFTVFDTSSINASDMGLKTSDVNSLTASRNYAVNQMYAALNPVANSIINNAPYFNSSINCADANTTCANSYTYLPYGVPLTIGQDYCKAYVDPTDGAACGTGDTAGGSKSYSSIFSDSASNLGSYGSGGLCLTEGYWTQAWNQSQIYDPSTWDVGNDLTGASGYKSDACLAWGLEPSNTNSNQQVLMRGTEIQDAIKAYNGYMQGSLYVVSQSSNASDYKSVRAFIQDAEQSGWLMAGAYYFRLAILTSQVLQNTSGSNSVDTTSGLEICTPGDVTSCGSGVWSTVDMTGIFGGGTYFTSSANKKLFNTDTTTTQAQTLGRGINELAYVIDGNDSGHPTVPPVQQNTAAQPVYATSSENNNSDGYSHPNSVYGFLINSTALVTPSQPGDEPPEITMKLTFNASTNVPQLGESSMSGGKWNVPGQVITYIYNKVLRHFFNWLLEMIVPMVNMVFFAFMMPPLTLLASVFSGAMEVLKNPNVNPILALTNMGVGFIEGVGNSWILMAAVGVGAAMLGPAVIGLLMLLLPIVMSWLGILFSVGATAAYYLPLTPFMVFLFASIGWLIGVIEAMVAAPVVALGVMHPEGDQAFGKGDQALMLLLGIFLRPPMMILGYIFGIILSYVGIWFVNAGFTIVIPQVENMPDINPQTGGTISSGMQQAGQFYTGNTSTYGMWSTIFLYFFLLIIYISTIIAVVNQAFEMIHYLPDKVLRWISGGAAEQLGERAAQGGMQDVKRQHDGAAQKSSQAMAKVNSALMSKIVNAAKDAKDSMDSGGESGAEGGEGGDDGGTSAEGSQKSGQGKKGDKKKKDEEEEDELDVEGDMTGNSSTSGAKKKKKGGKKKDDGGSTPKDGGDGGDGGD
jgi:defect-in-organelle-trafficking protein DotA